MSLIKPTNRVNSPKPGGLYCIHSNYGWSFRPNEGGPLIMAIPFRDAPSPGHAVTETGEGFIPEGEMVVLLERTKPKEGQQGNFMMKVIWKDSVVWVFGFLRRCRKE